MLEDVEVSRSLMKRMKSTGEMTEPWGTPALTECRLKRKPSTLTAIDLIDLSRIKSAKGVPVSLVIVKDSLRSKGPVHVREEVMR